MTPNEIKTLKVGDALYRNTSLSGGQQCKVRYMDLNLVVLEIGESGITRPWLLTDVVGLQQFKKLVPYIPFNEKIPALWSHGDDITLSEGLTTARFNLVEGNRVIPSSMEGLTRLRDLIDRCIKHQPQV